MNRPYRPDDITGTTPSADQPARQADQRASRAPSMMRKFEVIALDANGEMKSGTHIAPAHPIFEDAATAFVRGTILQTSSGPMAIEDLLPGDQIIAADGQSRKLLWVGSTMVVPTASGQRAQMRHTWRITANKFGVGRPMPDLMLGPAARLLVERSSVRAMMGVPAAMMNVADLADDLGLICLTPPSPVRVYHVMLEEHCLIRAAGIEVESYHPGEDVASTVGPNMLSLYMSLFPHVREVADFGPLALPRVTRDVLDTLGAA